MDMMTAVKSVLRNYVGFQGRAPRSEFWWWYLFYLIVAIVLGIIDATVIGSDAGILGAVWVLATLLPFLAVSVRRLHDIDRSGWWILIGIIPLVGWILIIYWYTRPSDEAANRFGENPFGSSDVFT